MSFKSVSYRWLEHHREREGRGENKSGQLKLHFEKLANTFFILFIFLFFFTFYNIGLLSKNQSLGYEILCLDTTVSTFSHSVRPFQQLGLGFKDCTAETAEAGLT